MCLAKDLMWFSLFYLDTRQLMLAASWGKPKAYHRVTVKQKTCRLYNTNHISVGCMVNKIYVSCTIIKCWLYVYISS